MIICEETGSRRRVNDMAGLREGFNLGYKFIVVNVCCF